MRGCILVATGRPRCRFGHQAYFSCCGRGAALDSGAPRTPTTMRGVYRICFSRSLRLDLGRRGSFPTQRAAAFRPPRRPKPRHRRSLDLPHQTRLPAGIPARAGRQYLYREEGGLADAPALFGRPSFRFICAEGYPRPHPPSSLRASEMYRKKGRKEIHPPAVSAVLSSPCTTNVRHGKTSDLLDSSALYLSRCSPPKSGTTTGTMSHNVDRILPDL
jgi:hypothetical protein